ncbi:hypothetical protein SAY86_024145 [Trapa natans]|uniref:Protein LNK3 n=1 Tax=Trapa natans TaxID=22666 RepID=A0AAN7LW23_TRANT|nr:hypothetical protein SAY86_024145 [Trapa natans]
MEGHPESTYHAIQEKAIPFHTFDAPKNAESSDWLMPSNTWPQWGSGGDCETLWVPEKDYAMGLNTPLDGYFQGIADCPGSMMLPSSYLKKNIWQNAPLDISDFDLYDLRGAAQEDNLFLNSSQDLSGKEELHGPFCSCPDCPYELNLAENSWLDSAVSQSFISRNNCMDGSNFCESDRFTASMEWDKVTTAPQSVSCNNTQEMISASMVSPLHIQFPSQQTEMSPEESTLQELSTVMGKFTKKTRICLRDSLYRLAESAKQQQFDHNRTLRSEGGKVETETNIIDRTVANIMYNRKDCSVGTLDLPHGHQVPTFSSQ